MKKLTASDIKKHNRSVGRLVKVAEKSDQNKLVNGFLYSLSTGRIEYMTAIASYIYAKKLIRHDPLMIGRSSFCQICGMDMRSVDGSFVYESIVKHLDSLDHMQTADYALRDLMNYKTLPEVKYTKEDADILCKILDVARNMGPNNKYTALQKKITGLKIIKANAGRINLILGVLSTMGILEAPDRRGYNEVFTPFGERGFDGYETDNFYPLVHWRGKYGVNEENLRKFFPEDVINTFDGMKSGDFILQREQESLSKGREVRKSRGSEAFDSDESCLKLDDLMRCCYGLSSVDPSWDVEVVYSVTHSIYKRTKVFFEGERIKKVIYEERTPSGEGYVPISYSERDISAKTEGRYFLLPKTPRGRKKPWTVSLLDSPTYIRQALRVYIMAGKLIIDSYDYVNDFRVPLSPVTAEESREGMSGFYRYTERIMGSMSESSNDADRELYPEGR